MACCAYVGVGDQDIRGAAAGSSRSGSSAAHRHSTRGWRVAEGALGPAVDSRLLTVVKDRDLMSRAISDHDVTGRILSVSGLIRLKIEGIPASGISRMKLNR